MTSTLGVFNHGFRWHRQQSGRWHHTVGQRRGQRLNPIFLRNYEFTLRPLFATKSKVISVSVELGNGHSYRDQPQGLEAIVCAKVCMNRLILQLALMMALSGCGGSSMVIPVDPLTVRETVTKDIVRLKSRQEVMRSDLEGVLYVLPPGPYFPFAEDDNGVFYQCISGLVSDLRNIPSTDIKYMHHIGGFYLPNDPAVDATPWIIVNLRGYLAGKIQIDQETALRTGDRCSEIGYSEVSSPNGVAFPEIYVDVIPTGPGAEQVSLGQRVTTNVTVSALANFISYAVMSSQDGKMVRLRIKQNGGRKLRDDVSPRTR